ncbi:MAG: hypothetical protein OEY64_03140 [Nitrospinota bacterium]|nr:hypothetical protein [Nitrospinota bacterium]
MANEQEITLENVGGGVAAELFAIELEKVVANIADPNIEAEGVREITLKVRFKPDKQRKTSPVDISVSSKLAGRRAHSAMAYFGKDQTGRPVVIGYNPNQTTFNFMPEGVSAINEKKEAKHA